MVCLGKTKFGRRYVSQIANDFRSAWAHFLIPFGFAAGAVIEDTVPSALWAVEWQVSVQVLVARLYAMGAAPFGATTLTSKFTIRSPDMVGEVAPMPWAV